MVAKFRTKHEVATGAATVTIGRRSNAPAFKIEVRGSVFIIDETEANDLADALDNAITAFESDPLLWEGGSQ